MKAHKAQNVSREIKIEKVVISAGGKAGELEKSRKLLELISGKKAQIITTAKRIPTFDVRPGLEVGTRVTLRNEEAVELLKRLLGAIENILKTKQIAENHFSFGIQEYIEIPGMEYQRDIGIKGLNTTVDFVRQGARVSRRRIKTSRLPKKQRISKEEIIKFMEGNFKTKFI